ncbi:UxaA family hydrolase [Sporomusa sp. KB1]|jgi:(2R)-sulfolactate sulfo-lyase subunit alpha|uniref:UxaA family hydrolase n=1 Tax=Sporomusa sp. KB1 TaxID=943346 RepID=UPI0011AA3944|nr:UxaA family hydrolase [Sporomusa sp. KB1]TWH51800.1 (2R)-sulfolactate sulfo-lyase subunit alpha [Sporomusa sp. KB1]
MMHKFLIHGKEDNVGVAVQDIKAGEDVVGIFLDTDTEITVKANQDIQLGHKIALNMIKTDDFVVEYAEIIGKATKSISRGDWVHIHNIKSARW